MIEYALMVMADITVLWMEIHVNQIYATLQILRAVLTNCSTILAHVKQDLEVKTAREDALMVMVDTTVLWTEIHVNQIYATFQIL